MLVAVLLGLVAGFPENPWAASSAAHSVLGHLAQETPQLLLGPRLWSQRPRQKPQEWWEVRLTMA